MSANTELDRVFGGEDGHSPIRFEEVVLTIDPAALRRRAAIVALRQAAPMEPVGFGWHDFAVLLSTSFAALVGFVIVFGLFVALVTR